jgi:radical SAM superfamily enzyme YgiQ (UPF0313 family)
MTGGHSMFRPPAEADSVLLRVADGCPHNSCAFCAMYRGVAYRVHDLEAVSASIDRAAAKDPDARRVFLADGDVLALPAEKLNMILTKARAALPRLARVNCYASGQALAGKSAAELAGLRKNGLHTLYLGLESGSAEVLRRMAKGGTVRGMIEGCVRAQNAGLSVSVMVLIGIGGQELSARHVRQTAEALNAMQPALLSCLRLVPIPGTKLASQISSGHFVQLTQEQCVRELRDMLSKLELARTVFRADHSSNILPLSGRLPRDAKRLVEELDELLECGCWREAPPDPCPSRSETPAPMSALVRKMRPIFSCRTRIASILAFFRISGHAKRPAQPLQRVFTQRHASARPPSSPRGAFPGKIRPLQ